MKVTAKLHEGSKKLDLGKKASVRDALGELRINPETVLVKRKDEIMLGSEKLKENDEIEIIRIVSGG